jgi:hypothetical protein
VTRWRGRRGSALHVECGPGGPLRFRREGRPYLVLAVLAHWVESGAWWVHGGTSSTPQERQVWRVEVRAEGHDTTGVHDLMHDGRTWRLIRTLD